MVEEVQQKKQSTLSEIISNMESANEGTANMCCRLSVLVAKLFVGVPPNGPTVNASKPDVSVRGTMEHLDENVENHYAANRRLDELISQLEAVIN